MATALTRRERELIRRENLILQTARSLILKKGFLGLKMSELAEAVEYSVGTLYAHFETKEDLLVALAVQSIGQRAALFEQVRQAERPSRDRIYGILIARLLLSERSPERFDIERLASSPSVWKRATQPRYQKMVAMEQRCSNLVLEIIQDGIATAELSADAVGAADIIFGLWSMSIGFHRLVETFPDLSQVGVSNAFDAFKINYCLLLDSYGWEPRQGWDAAAVEADFRQNVFA